MCVFFFFFKQKTAYEIKECDWSSDVCSSDLNSTYYTNIQGVLIYNETNYIGTKYGTGDTITFNKTITIPNINTETNMTFYWEIELIKGGSIKINSTFNNQTINILNIDDCSSYSILILNYTLRDEETQEIINAITHKDRKSTRLNSSHIPLSRMPSSA